MSSYYFILKKSRVVLSNSFYSKVTAKNEKKYRYFLKLDNHLRNMGNPYNLDYKKYIFIKYFLSIFLSIISYINSKNILVSIILYFFIFFIPNILLKLYSKKESIQIVDEISNIVQNIILSLSVNMSLYDSLNMGLSVINNERFKKEYSIFIENYMLYNFNIIKSIELFSKKYNSYEFNMFLSILSQGEKQGNLLELLETFSDTLDLILQKNLKYKLSKNMISIIISTIILLLNSFAIVLYPIIIEITNSFSQMFK